MRPVISVLKSLFKHLKNLAKKLKIKNWQNFCGKFYFGAEVPSLKLIKIKRLVLDKFNFNPGRVGQFGAECPFRENF